MPDEKYFYQIDRKFQEIQDKICASLVDASGDNYWEDYWDYKKGSGGGKSRIFIGKIIEKGGVNFSSIQGKLEKNIAKNLNQSLSADGSFRVCGVSVIIHPYNPFLAAIHLNIRFFQSGEKQWFGGGVDLNPYYPLREDIMFFHQSLKNFCDSFDKSYYPKFKKNCDNYFYNRHRQEARGVGGIFFDQLFSGNTFAFVQQLANFFINTYSILIKKRMNTPFNEYQRKYQAHRRARYAEFNLLYDKGTAFGLQTGGRVKSIFLSLPPSARWDYDFLLTEGSKEQEHQKYFQPQDWVS